METVTQGRVSQGVRVSEKLKGAFLRAGRWLHLVKKPDDKHPAHKRREIIADPEFLDDSYRHTDFAHIWRPADLFLSR